MTQRISRSISRRISQSISAALVIAGLTVGAMSATAEGLADQRSERDLPSFASILELDDVVSSSPFNTTQSIEALDLNYIGGTALERHPELTAHQRKRLVFGSK